MNRTKAQIDALLRRLWRYQREYDLTQSEVAALVEADQGTISRWQRAGRPGGTRPRGRRAIERIERVVGT